MVENLIKNINNNYKRLEKIQTQISTGSTVQLPSDDPAAVSTIMRTKRAINESAQFIANTNKGTTWLDSADSALSEGTKVLHRARELIARGSNGTNSHSELEIIAEEVDQLIKHLVNVANSAISGRYIFAGQKTLTQPFQYNEEAGTISYHGDNEYIQVEISPGVKESIGEPGIKIFGKADEPGDKGIFATLIKASNDLKAGVNVSANLEDFDIALEDLLQRQTAIGTKSQGMALAKDRLEEQNLSFKKLLSETQDVDMAKASIDLLTNVAVHTMSLKVGAQIIQPSLIDFIR